MPAPLWTFLLKARLVLTLAAAAALMSGAALVFVGQGHLDPVPAPNAVVTPARSPSRSVHDRAVAASTPAAPPPPPADASVPLQIVSPSQSVEKLPVSMTAADKPLTDASTATGTPAATTPEPTATDGHAVPAPAPAPALYAATSTRLAPPPPSDASVPVQLVAFSRPVEELATSTPPADGPATAASIAPETPSAVPSDSTVAATPEPTATDG